MKAPFVAICLAFCPVALAAPAPKGNPEIVGEFETSLNSPTVVLPSPDEPTGRKQYWLVFANQSTENQANKFQTGDRVKVAGRLMVGGTFRYVIVDSISKDE